MLKLLNKNLHRPPKTENMADQVDMNLTCHELNKKFTIRVSKEIKLKAEKGNVKLYLTLNIYICIFLSKILIVAL